MNAMDPGISLFGSLLAVAIVCLVIGLPSLWVARVLERKLPLFRATFLKGGILLFAASFLLVLLIRVFLAKYFSEGDASAGESIAADLYRFALIQAVVCLAALLFIARSSGRQGLRSAGFLQNDPWTSLLFGLFAYLAFIPLYGLFCIFNNLLIPYEPQELVKEMLSAPELLKSPVVIACSAIILPVIEEILFRGFLLSGLREFMKPVFAVIASALVFGLMHEFQAVIPVFTLGCLLGYLRERTGSLLPAVAVHVLHNSLMLVFIHVL